MSTYQYKRHSRAICYPPQPFHFNTIIIWSDHPHVAPQSFGLTPPSPQNTVIFWGDPPTQYLAFLSQPFDTLLQLLLMQLNPIYATQNTPHFDFSLGPLTHWYSIMRKHKLFFLLFGGKWGGTLYSTWVSNGISIHMTMKLDETYHFKYFGWTNPTNASLWCTMSGEGRDWVMS